MWSHLTITNIFWAIVLGFLKWKINQLVILIILQLGTSLIPTLETMKLRFRKVK